MTDSEHDTVMNNWTDEGSKKKLMSLFQHVMYIKGFNLKVSADWRSNFECVQVYFMFTEQ